MLRLGLSLPSQAARKGGAAAASSFTALRLRSITNGGSHRTTAAEVDFLSGGVEISKTATTAFEGGDGSVGSAASGAFDDNVNTNWSRVSSFGVAFVGLRGYSPAVLPTQVRITSDFSGSAATESPFTFVVEGSNDTTTGVDGSWTQIGAQQAKSDWTAAQQTITFTL